MQVPEYKARYPFRIEKADIGVRDAVLMGTIVRAGSDRIEIRQRIGRRQSVFLCLVCFVMAAVAVAIVIFSLRSAAAGQMSASRLVFMLAASCVIFAVGFVFLLPVIRSVRYRVVFDRNLGRIMLPDGGLLSFKNISIPYTEMQFCARTILPASGESIDNTISIAGIVIPGRKQREFPLFRAEGSSHKIALETDSFRDYFTRYMDNSESLPPGSIFN